MGNHATAMALRLPRMPTGYFSFPFIYFASTWKMPALLEGAGTAPGIDLVEKLAVGNAAVYGKRQPTAVSRRLGTCKIWHFCPVAPAELSLPAHEPERRDSYKRIRPPATANTSASSRSPVT
jgi:hypothetical protein